MPAITPGRIAVADANVLINLIHAQRLEMLASLPRYEFVVPEDVISEITDSAQRAPLEAGPWAGDTFLLVFDGRSGYSHIIAMRFADDPEAAAWLDALEGNSEDFDWDAGNRTKSRKHGVEAGEVEALLG